MNRPAVISYGKSRERISWRAWLIILLACASPVIVYMGGPPLVNAIRTRYWLSRIKNYSRPASEIVYTDDPAKRKNLEKVPGYATGSVDGRAIMYREPPEWRHLNNADRETHGIVSHGVVLLHQIPHQIPRQDDLIYCCVIDFPTAPFQPPQRSLVISGSTLDDWYVNAHEVAGFTRWPETETLRIALQPEDKVTIFAAQPNADGEPFSFDLLINQNRYTFDVSWEAHGWLRYHARQGKLVRSTPDDSASVNEWHPNG